jgi:tripartite-type tricarboxylate transporter receptor subunit TctC
MSERPARMAEPRAGATRRALLGAGLGLPAPGRAAAQPLLPKRPFTPVIPCAPGGRTDVIGRAIATGLARALGQPALVENRVSGATYVGSPTVAQARPDEHVPLLGSTSLAINPTLTPREPMRALAPVGLVCSSSLLLMHPSVPARSIRDFLDRVRAHPGALNYGSSGNGAPNHLIFALLAHRVGLALEHVPYRGAEPALLDLRAGRIQALFHSSMQALLLREGAIHALATSSRHRSSAMPDLPAIAETLPGFDAVFRRGLFAPAGTPAPAIAALSDALGATPADPRLRGRVASEGGEIQAGVPAELAALLVEETASWGELIRATGLRAD